jgi:uncharacterized protein (TIGR00299 family) protein
MITKLAYLQCPTGIAGDMCLGALVDVGVPLEYLIKRLESLDIQEEYSLRSEKVYRQNQVATKVDVDLTNHPHPHHRHLPFIQNLINNANFPPQVTTWSLAVFEQLAIAESRVHGIAPEQVYFHEVGATDAIIDIVGTCLGLDYLGIKQLYCSPLPSGGGTVKTAHGNLSVPVPAVLQLWQTRQVPIYSNGLDQELVTPTGAAIVTTLAQEFGNPPEMQLEKIGFGAGSQDFAQPNILRLWLGTKKESDLILEKIAVLETQIDDLNPQVLGYVFEKLIAIGAKDVFTQPIGMKKSRPGILLTVICSLEKINLCEDIIFQETTTLGIRRKIETRSILPRKIIKVTTKYGEVRVKIATKDQQIVNLKPEYEDCATLARKHNLPWQLIYQATLNTWSLMNDN